MIPPGHRFHVALVAAVLVLFLVPARVLAQEPKEDVYVRVNGTVDLPAGESVGTLVAVNSPANVAGSVRDTLVVVNQDATVSGEIGRDVFVWNGTLRLEAVGPHRGRRRPRQQRSPEPGRGRHDQRSDPGTKRGVDQCRAEPRHRVVLLCRLARYHPPSCRFLALGWAAIGGRQLSSTAGLLGARPGLAAGAAVIVWIAVPLLAVLALVTVIGIPLGITVLLIGLPLLWVLGYVTTSTRLGFFFDDLRHVTPSLTHPYLEAVAGVVVFQLIGLIPIVGGLVVALAGLFGAGAVVVHAWRRVSSES